MGWTFVYLMLFLKLPILALLGIVWWAIRQQPDPHELPSDGGIGGRPHPRRPFPRRPTPRRGPHGEPAPASPPRVRSAAVRARTFDR